MCSWRLSRRGEASMCFNNFRVTRGSSAATVGTEDRIVAARSVKSDRLPIGVATTYSVDII